MDIVDRPPLLILDTVRRFLDEHGLGAGVLRAERIGEGGGSNFSFLLEREDGSRFVLRRPPRPPLPPTAHDVVRESKLQLALAPLGIRVPNIRAVCEDASLLGVPFYVMDYVDGQVVTNELPPPLDADPAARRRLADDLVDTLVEIHAADVTRRRWRRSRGRATTTSGRSDGLRSCGRSTRRASCPPSSRSEPGSPRTCRSSCLRPSSTATTGWGT